MNEPQSYAVKAMYPAESIEIAERIEWCKENDIQFSNVSIMGCYVNGQHYTKEEMKETGVLTLTENGRVAEIDLSTLPPKNIGIGFVFRDREDALAFKIRWS